MAEQTMSRDLGALFTGEFSILLVEDDSNDVLLFGRAAKKNTAAVPFHFATDGEDAKAYLLGEGRYADRASYPLPRIILTDLKMPRLNGFELLLWIKQHSECGVIPVMVLSSSSLSEDIERAFALGASAYFVKPSTLEGLTALIKTILEFWSLSRIPAYPNNC